MNDTLSAWVKAKQAGLPSLEYVAAITGRDKMTLNNWSKFRPEFFAIVLDGCLVAYQKEQAAKISEEIKHIPIIYGDSVEFVRIWLRQLQQAGLLWDTVFNAHEADFSPLTPTHEQLNLLEKCRKEALIICVNHNTNIETLYPEDWQKGSVESYLRTGDASIHG